MSYVVGVSGAMSCRPICIGFYNHSDNGSVDKGGRQVGLGLSDIQLMRGES